MILAGTVLALKLTLVNGLWIARIPTTKGVTLKMVVDTGSNATLLVDSKGFENGVCVQQDKSPVCSHDPLPTWMVTSQFAEMKKHGVDGVLGNDFWIHFKSITIDINHRTNRGILTASK